MEANSSAPGGVVVLGATGSVGSELARWLRAEGRPVLLAGRDAERLAALAHELDAPAVPLAATDSASVDGAIAAAVEAFGSVSGVAHCVGSLLLRPAHATSDDQWRETIEINLFSAFAAVRAAVQAMRSGGGSIALVSSAAASIGLANHEAIAAAKAGVEGLVRAAAASYASRGVRVNAVAPGLVKSHLSASLWQNEAAAAGSRQMHALARLGEPADVAAALAWLLSSESSWVTGQVLGVDGGLATVLPRPTTRPA
ncbi:MAG: SDR family oxidoreductase [Pirellulales bacterium]|nr:SDR family oxidoreductase [Pirellulales bacterium]